MQAKTPRGAKKRSKSKKVSKAKASKSKTAKRGTRKAVKTTARKKKFEYPITETLEWVAEGEQLLRKWGAIKSPFAKKIAKGFETLLTVLGTVNELRKM